MLYLASARATAATAAAASKAASSSHTMKSCCSHISNSSCRNREYCNINNGIIHRISRSSNPLLTRPQGFIGCCGFRLAAAPLVVVAPVAAAAATSAGVTLRTATSAAGAVADTAAQQPPGPAAGAVGTQGATKFSKRLLAAAGSGSCPSYNKKPLLAQQQHQQQEQELRLNNDTAAAAALACYSNGELLRSILVYGLCTSDLLVNNCEKLLSLSCSLLGPRLTFAALRITFFKVFCGGEDLQQVCQTIEKLQQRSRRCI